MSAPRPERPCAARARRGKNRLAAFTLLELLAVLAIISILAVLAMSAVQPISESYGITTGANAIRDALGGAKQVAMSDNLPVQVRFCRSTLASPSIYAWLLVCEVQPDGSLKNVDRPLHLPTAMCVATNSTLSSVMANTEIAAVPSDPAITTIGQQYSYRKFTFYPSGATDLAPTSIWYITVVPQRSNAATALPLNYATIQIDPVNGLTTLYRP